MEDLYLFFMYLALLIIGFLVRENIMLRRRLGGRVGKNVLQRLREVVKWLIG